jgi:PAS domain S-box-containing protein
VTPARILIVEDDRVVARDLAQQLASMGHTVAGMASRGEDVLSRTLDTRADLVLMDIRLEGPVDGITAAQQVRDKCQIPVVFLTGYADDATTRRAGLTEPFGYLLKPFQEPQLLTTIEMALYKHAAERKLRASERRYATTLSSIGDGVISTDASAAVTFMNPAAEALTGWKSDEAVGRQLSEIFRLVSEVTGESLEDPAAMALRHGAAVALPQNTSLTTRDGRDLPIDDSSAPIVGDDGAITGTVLVFSDVTGRREAEEALRQARDDLARASRMTTLGELAASIAHEVNQPLMAIVTSAEACLRWLASDAPDLEHARQAAGRVVRNGHRAAEVIASVRALAQKTNPSMTVLELPAVIDEVLGLFRAEIRRRTISLQADWPDGLPRVTADPVQIQQVVANLLLNAMEAVADLDVATIWVDVRVVEAQAVLVAVSDGGRGVQPDMLKRMFDPLVTTKSGGMGLGLSIARTIIEAHGGSIWADHRAPRGTIVQFTLPVVDDDRSSAY